MGGTESKFLYSTPLGDFDMIKGETPIYRRVGFEHTLVDRLPSHPEVNNFQELMLNTFKHHGKNPALGTREKLADGKLGDYKFKTYNEVKEICFKFGVGIQRLKLAPKINEYKDLNLSFMGVYSKNREEYTICDITSALFGHVIVPIYDTLGPEAVQFVFEQTNLTTIYCSNNYIGVLTKSAKEKKLGKVTNIVVWEPYTSEEKKALEEAGVTLYSMKEIIDAGEGVPVELPQIKPDDVFCFSYTSGTTSMPKAAMLTHKNFVSALAGVETGVDPGIIFTEKDVHFSYLPLAHIYDRLCCAYMLCVGGRIGYFSGDVQKIKDDLAALKPTFFTSVPRLYNKIYDGIMGGINEQTGVKKMLIDTAISTKTENLKNKVEYTHGLYDAIVFKKMREAVGGQMRFMTTAAAPISAERLNFLKIAMSCPIVEAYGQTESTGASFFTHTKDPSVGHVGGPNPACEFKLVDVPDMKYTSQDRNEKGERCPKGEICLRGPMIFKGYYKDDVKTKEAIDEDGWLHTGDVGLVEAGGRLKIIDRKKNIFKLAHGEYIAPEKIETVLTRSKLVAEIYVYGDTLQTFCVMLIHPNPAELIEFCKKKGITEESYEKLCDNKEVNKIVLAELERVGRAEGLQGFEIPKRLYLKKESFGKDGLLTGTLKLKRNEVKDFCREIIQDLYKDA
eukprot:CAMPEP_0176463596 /NCGR_PEP_ID=MMETSP0127-20121128/35986_1 /TAXON_ID=938130 /ORGANISM="Platyophrya macrostoma, Strain WH" /LENGTH=674 /DNA_ID=CAMNT_0017855793 /DNA_START=18 /DNA_END=2042 /DNA_ORIENTATION=+